MRNKPELLTTAASLDEMKVLIAAGADAFVVGESKYGMRLPGQFDEAGIAEAVKLAKPSGVNIYVSVNNIMDNKTVEELPAYMKRVAEAGADAIVFGDPAVLAIAREAAPGLKLHWNAEMTSTNYSTANYWGRRGATRFVLARELNLEQIAEIRQHTELEIQVQVHGMTNIYHSKRSLIGSFLEHQGKGERQAGLRTAEGLYLTEAERPGERYPIYEDEYGTHMMSPDDICMLDALHELLELGVDSLKIEGFMKPLSYNEIVVKSYRAAVDAYFANPAQYEFNENWLEAIREVQDPNRELTYGFFFKEQVY